VISGECPENGKHGRVSSLLSSKIYRDPFKIKELGCLILDSK
jgi:hypothetical protein